MEIISFKEAESLMSDTKSELKKITQTINLYLPPKYLGCVKSGVIEILNSKRKRFSDILDGAIFAFDNIKFIHSVGRIFDDAPFIHYDIKADFIVFRPTVGSTLKGVVNKLGRDHIGCLVHRCFNASLRAPHHLSGQQEGAGLNLGDEVLLRVTEVCCNNEVMSVKGQLSSLLHARQESVIGVDEPANGQSVVSHSSQEKFGNEMETESYSQSSKTKAIQKSVNTNKRQNEATSCALKPMELSDNDTPKSKRRKLSNLNISKSEACISSPTLNGKKRKKDKHLHSTNRLKTHDSSSSIPVKEEENEHNTTNLSESSLSLSNSEQFSSISKKHQLKSHDNVNLSESSLQLSDGPKKRKKRKHQSLESTYESGSSLTLHNSDQYSSVHKKKKKMGSLDKANLSESSLFLESSQQISPTTKNVMKKCKSHEYTNQSEQGLPLTNLEQCNSSRKKRKNSKHDKSCESLTSVPTSPQNTVDSLDSKLTNILPKKKKKSSLEHVEISETSKSFDYIPCNLKHSESEKKSRKKKHKQKRLSV
ncbi:hypothetical protein ScPMuIL_015528 [Solemya velum]